MTPALLTRISSRSDFARNWSAACLIEAKEVRSICRKVMLLFGTLCLISAMAASALEGVRAARKISLGDCFASCKTVSLPRPVLPVLLLAEVVGNNP